MELVPQFLSYSSHIFRISSPYHKIISRKRNFDLGLHKFSKNLQKWSKFLKILLFKLETSKLRNMLLVYSKTHISWKNVSWWPHFGAGTPRKCQNFLFSLIEAWYFIISGYVTCVSQSSYQLTQFGWRRVLFGIFLTLEPTQPTGLISMFKHWFITIITGCGIYWLWKYTILKASVYWLLIVHWGLCDRLIALVKPCTVFNVVRVGMIITGWKLIKI